MGLFNKKELERITELKEMVAKLEKSNNELTNKLNDANAEISKIKKDNKSYDDLEKTEEYIKRNRRKLEDLRSEIKERYEYIEMLKIEEENMEKQVENTIVAIESGTFDFNYHYEDSQRYEEELKRIKEEQKEMVKWECAIEHSVQWQVNGSSRKGETQMKNIDKLLLRAFNNECDNIIMNVKYSTIVSSKTKIEKSFNQLNNFVKTYECYITKEYLELKIKELELKCGYVTMKQREKEEQQRIKEQMREEERVRKELEAEEKKVEKEEMHFMNELNKLQKRLNKENEETQAKLLKQIEELQSKLAEISEVKADIMNRRMNNKAGYVYVISNKGSFGENVYKIGVTRRLDPQIRVDELSSASVPFKFDVNAMIFSDDAFALENKLHQIFNDNRVNKVNMHKEFFNVSIDEIEKAVKENFNETVEFNKTILNEEYVLSLSM